MTSTTDAKFDRPAGPPRLVVAEGTAAEMGHQIGDQTADLISHSVETYCHRFQVDAGLSLIDVRQAGKRFGEQLAEYDSDIYATMQAMAGSSGQDFELLIALNARTELLYGTRYEEGGCTSLSVMPEASRSGHVLIGQNWDWRVEQQEAAFVLATRDDTGLAVIALTEAGMLMKSGMNSAGIGLCNNLLVSDRDGSGVGVPMHFLIRGAIQQRRMSLAHQKLLPQRRLSSANIMLADAGGEAIDFELVPDDFGVIYPEDGIITHANHFETSLPVEDRKRSTFALTLLRSKRLRRLLRNQGQMGQIDLPDIAKAFRDGYSSPDAICRYPDDNLPAYNQLATIFSVVMDLTTKDFWIAGFPVDRQPSYRWNLDHVFDNPTATVGLLPEGILV